MVVKAQFQKHAPRVDTNCYSPALYMSLGNFLSFQELQFLPVVKVDNKNTCLTSSRKWVNKFLGTFLAFSKWFLAMTTSMNLGQSLHIQSLTHMSAKLLIHWTQSFLAYPKKKKNGQTPFYMHPPPDFPRFPRPFHAHSLVAQTCFLKIPRLPWAAGSSPFSSAPSVYNPVSLLCFFRITLTPGFPGNWTFAQYWK